MLVLSLSFFLSLARTHTHTHTNLTSVSLGSKVSSTQVFIDSTVSNTQECAWAGESASVARCCAHDLDLCRTKVGKSVSTTPLSEDDGAIIDVGCILDVLRNLRKYGREISCLIDCRHKCLFGVNEKTRQEISLTHVMQLYISIYQHQSVVEHLWRQIVPIFNHTIRNNIEEFKKHNTYQASNVIRNLVQNILDSGARGQFAEQ